MQLDAVLPVPLIVAGVVTTFGFAALRIRSRAARPGLFRTTAMAVLALVIALDPTIAGGTGEVRTAAVDVLFVVDTTGSMAAEDYDGDSPRLDGVRADIVELAARFPGAHFSLIRFDSQPRLEVPWTTDAGALEAAVSVLRQERAAFSAGSSLDLPLGLIDQQLPRSSGGAGVVFYFSDGEERAGDPGDPAITEQTPPATAADEAPASFADLAATIDGGAVFGYGTASGAPMAEFVGAAEIVASSDTGYVRDFSADAPAISRLDEENLVAVAEELGLPYLHRGGPGSLAALASSIADDAPTTSDGSGQTRRHLYWIPALALFAIVLWQAAASVNELLTTRRLFRETNNAERASA